MADFTARRVRRAQLCASGFDEDRWLGQPYFPIFIVEKDTMEPATEPMASRWQMPFPSSRGYSSLRLQHEVAERLIHRYAQTGQGAIVYFASDLDPSGLDLQRAWEAALDAFTAPVSRFVRIALTLEQVENLPPGAPVEIDVKPSDSRSEQYIAQYGPRCWEADILPAATIEAELDLQVGAWLDLMLWRQRGREIERARQLL